MAGFARTAAIAVDFQKECLDPRGKWPVHDGAQVLANAAAVIGACRAAGVPVVYTQQWLDPSGSDSPRHERLPSGRQVRSVAGTPMAEICAEVAPRPGEPVVRKQRWSAFYGSNLDVVLDRLDVEHLIMFGVWTEACFETTVWDAQWRDYRISIVKDACGTATRLMHMTAILDLANWLYGGSVFTAAEMAKALRGEPHRAWRFENAGALCYTAETVEALYESL
jgi:nicotinamidase-related amidase